MLSRLLLAALAVAGLACGSRQIEVRLQRLRFAHDVVPLGASTVRSPSGEPVLVVSLQVTNQGTVHLPHLTVLVRVRGGDGVEKVSRRVTLDLAAVRPGVAAKVEASVPGVELGERDEVLVELESSLPPDQLRELPELRDLLAMPR